MKLQRGKISKLINYSSFEMVDFYNSCPFIFEGETLKTRRQEVVMWRNIGMVWGWLGGKSLQKAGEEFGRDHSTVIHAIKQIINAYEGFGYPEIIENIDTIKEKSKNFVYQTDDINVNYVRNLIRLDDLLGKKLKKIVD
jgi:hypothetical protein